MKGAPKSTKPKPQNAIAAKNWLLVGVASVIIVINIILLVLIVMCPQALGWLSWLVGIGCIGAISACLLAIEKNDPAWILLDAILPL